MSSQAAFSSLRERVLADPELQRRLRELTRWEDLAPAVGQLSGVPADVLETERLAARRAWLERDLPALEPPPLDPAAPAGFTPISFTTGAGGPQVEWCDLRELAGDDPFFLDRVQRALWEPYRLLFRARTGIGALEAAATALGPARPAGIVLHTSRCGSTLVCRMLAAAGTPVLSEPVPCDQVLRAAGTGATRARWLSWMLAAMGAHGAVVKLDAWSVLERPVLRAALPGVPWIFLFRDPAEVIASHARLPGMHMVPGVLPPELFGLDLPSALALPAEEYAAHVVGAVCHAALAQLDGDARLIAYEDLPDAVANEIAPHFGLAAGPAERELMRSAASGDAKRPGEVFDPVAAARERPITEAIRAAADRWASPAHAELERRRAAWS